MNLIGGRFNRPPTQLLEKQAEYDINIGNGPMKDIYGHR